nr:MAG: hypothetical protein KatS3mg041_0447 [Bacteroidota bacterium]
MVAFLLLWWAAAVPDSLLPLEKAIRMLQGELVTAYARLHEPEWRALAAQYGLEDDSTAHRRWATARLMYDLLRPGGWLGIRYLPLERRAELERLEPDDSLLWRARPLNTILSTESRWLVPEHARERIPRVFLEDLFSPAPRYRWGDTLLFGFGRCSELEMAYTALLRLADVPARIVMPEPSHVQTAVALRDGLWLVVDNTRASFMRRIWPYQSPYAPDVPLINRFYADWYAWRSRDSLSIQISSLAWERIRGLIWDRIHPPRRELASLPVRSSAILLFDSGEVLPLAGIAGLVLLLIGLLWRWKRKRIYASRSTRRLPPPSQTGALRIASGPRDSAGKEEFVIVRLYEHEDTD